MTRVTEMTGIKGTVSMNIKYFRKLKGLTQEMLAEKVEVSPVYISCLERGAKVPSLDLLGKIADALKVNPYLLLIQDNDPISIEVKKLLGTVCGLEKPAILFMNEVIAAFLKMKTSSPA